ncbi:MAG: hypothetical protein WAK08_01060, partial [Pseudolabrys sp.]
AKAKQAYHRRDLCSDVTARILAELDNGAVEWVQQYRTPFNWRNTMNGAVMTLARYHARQTIKRQLYAQGIKLAHVESREITIAANKYTDDHPEIIAFATEQYWDY